MITSINIKPEEFRARSDRLLEHIRAEGLSGVVLFTAEYVLYFTGFAFIPTERPMGFVMNAEGEKGLYVPRLEKEHAEAYSLIDAVEAYPEYPATPHPMEGFERMLHGMGITSSVGADTDGYPWIFGYRGPSLTEMLGEAPQRVTAFIEDRMMVKSPAEVALIRESATWGNLAHTLLQRYTEPGATETEVSLEAGREATLAMFDAIGPIYRSQSLFFNGAFATYRGQVGRGAAIPHALANNIVFEEGDVVVSGAGAPVWGYWSELERTMIIGSPSDEQRRMFEHMLALQDTAFAAIKPGTRCSEVDTAVQAYYTEHDLLPYWRHHVGHGLGLRYHEAPFMDVGDDTELVPGMVLSVEPGLYVPGLGGFRHSDTVLVTEDGIERLTYYPRDLDSLTI